MIVVLMLFLRSFLAALPQAPCHTFAVRPAAAGDPETERPFMRCSNGGTEQVKSHAKSMPIGMERLAAGLLK
jgi:hypothetical protein